MAIHRVVKQEKFVFSPDFYNVEGGREPLTLLEDEGHGVELIICRLRVVVRREEQWGAGGNVN